MPTTDFWEIVGWALACSVPVVVTGALIIRLARSWSLAVSMVALVLIPVLATFTGVMGATGFMITGTFERTAVVLVIVAIVTIPAAVMLGRYQARRTVWEAEIRDSERAAEQSRRRLVAFVSHDLRTPLAGIRAVSEAIADGVVPDDEVRVHAKHIENESVRLSEMVDDLFEMSKINAGALTPSFDKVALDEVVDDVLATHRIAAERAGVQLRAELPEQPVRVVGSDRALVRVLSNLVANAIAHTPEGGSVELSAGLRREQRVGPRRRHRCRHRRGGPAESVRRRLSRLEQPCATVGFVAAERIGSRLGDRGGAGSGASRHAVGAQPAHRRPLRGAPPPGRRLTGLAHPPFPPFPRNIIPGCDFGVAATRNDVSAPVTAATEVGGYFAICRQRAVPSVRRYVCRGETGESHPANQRRRGVCGTRRRPRGLSWSPGKTSGTRTGHQSRSR